MDQRTVLESLQNRIEKIDRSITPQDMYELAGEMLIILASFVAEKPKTLNGASSN